MKMTRMTGSVEATPLKCCLKNDRLPKKSSPSHIVEADALYKVVICGNSPC